MARWRTLPLVLEIATFACFSGLGADRIAGERVTAWPEGALVWAALAVVGLLWVAWGRRLYAGQVRAVAAERALTAERAGTPIPAVPK